MNQQDFVNILEKEVIASSGDGLISQLRQPAGRQPDKSVVERSNWFNGLDEKNKGMVESVIRLAARSAIFDVLCILDGVRVIEDPEKRGDLQLWYMNKSEKNHLNDPSLDPLHELMYE